MSFTSVVTIIWSNTCANSNSISRIKRPKNSPLYPNDGWTITNDRTMEASYATVDDTDGDAQSTTVDAELEPVE